MAVSPSYPGVYLNETASVPHVVAPATTNLTAVIGEFPQGTVDEAVLVTSLAQFNAEFGALSARSSLAALAVAQFFANDGIGAWIVRVVPPATPAGDATTVAATPETKDTPAPKGAAATPTVPDSTATPATGATAASASIVPPGGAAGSTITLTATSPGRWADDVWVALWPSGPPARPSTEYVDLLVTADDPGGPGNPSTSESPQPSSPPPQLLERVPNLPVGDAAVMAARINNSATSVSATVASVDATNSVTTLSGGDDGSWATGGFVDAVTAELQAGARLDQIAPNAFNLMCIPDAALLDSADQGDLYDAALAFCAPRQAFLLVDPPPPPEAEFAVPTTWGTTTPTPPNVSSVGGAGDGMSQLVGWAEQFLNATNVAGATFYPWVQIPDPTTGAPRVVPPSGTVAGVFARIDSSRGVWKAPAGTEATLSGVTGLGDATINDTVNGQLNIIGINCLRTFPLYGSLVWGSRTLAGSDVGSSPAKYIPVQRLRDFIEQSLQQSLRWAVFEPNGPGLWSSISLEVNSFMAALFREGAFAGATADQAYNVTCDATTTSPTDMISGIVNVNVAFAPIDPAEFVMLNIAIQAPPSAT